MRPFCMLSTIRHYRVDRHKIGYLKFILEGYEGLVTLSTVDAGRGIVALHMPPGCEKDAIRVMHGLASEIHMVPWCAGDDAQALEDGEPIGSPRRKRRFGKGVILQ